MKIHIVKKGDTLYSLSKKYGVSLDQLIAMNPQLVDPNQLSVGMKVKVPSKNYPTGDYEIIHKHVVKEGDTLWKLSKAWGVPLNVMIAANPQLKNPNILLIGQVINIAKLGSEIMEEGEAGTNNKHANMMPLSKAEKLQPKTEMLQPKAEEAQPEILQEQEAKKEEVALEKEEAAPKKEETVMPHEASEEVKSNILPFTKEEAAPIPLSQKDNEEYPIAPYAVYQPKEKVSSQPLPQMKPYTGSMPAIPLLPEIVVESAESNKAAAQPDYSMNNLVPCDPSLWFSGCNVNAGSYGWNGWGNPLATGCVQGVYLGNCPPGTMPLSNWDGMATQAYTMYTQYDPYQSPAHPSSGLAEMYTHSAYGMPSQDQSFAGFSNVPEANANVMYGQYSQPAASGYSNMSPSNAMNSLSFGHNQATKARIDGVEAGDEGTVAVEQQAPLTNEEIQDEGKSVPIKKSYKATKKKTKSSSVTKSRQKRGSVPWINA